MKSDTASHLEYRGIRGILFMQFMLVSADIGLSYETLPATIMKVSIISKSVAISPLGLIQSRLD
jgi:hypothetical protein